MIYAYDEELLDKARLSMASMYDVAVNIYGVSLETFQFIFCCSDISCAFARGDSCIVAGRSGAELAYDIIRKSGFKEVEYMQVFRLDRSAEYWLGWNLAYYQWLRNTSFQKIEDRIPIRTIYNMYQKYHELDQEHFVDTMDELMNRNNTESALKRIRIYAGLSQRGLAENSGVPVRTIQQYEQGQKDISKAGYSTVVALAQALHCSPERLIS